MGQLSGEEVLRALLLYHLMEVLQGEATRIDVAFDDGLLITRDDGRGMGIDRELAGRPYIDLVLGQLDLLDEADTPLAPEHLQLHAIGLSLAAAACSSFELVIDHAGERRHGCWNAGAGCVEWKAVASSDSHGTELRVRPRAGLPDATAARALVAALSARCPGVDVGLRTRA